MFTNLFGRPKQTAPRAQLGVEALEDRWAPAHVLVALPEAAFDAQQAAGNSPHLILILELESHARPGRVIE
jgi:hypothetical protein